MILSSIVLPANVIDRSGSKWLLYGKSHFLTKLQKLWADSAYNRSDFIKTTKEKTSCTIELVKKEVNIKEFKLLPKRWIIERTFA